MEHNLPVERPYKEFFGREEAIEEIRLRLLNRIAHIASIDGEGGIGKTALTYHFCEKVLIKEKIFDYLIWVSAKDTFLDSFDETQLIKRKENKFKVNPIEVLINETIKVVGFSDILLNKPLDEKKSFFEEEILRHEKIFFVIDNLENIQGDTFFQYLDSFANFNNVHLKILTTSRKRDKVMTDNAIQIKEMAEPDAVKMLRYLSESTTPPLRLILNETPKQNAILVNKANRIPILIEFIVGQLSFGKSIGQIMQILEGSNGKGMSDVISFMFQYMYEDLSPVHQKIFKSILAFQRNKKKDVPFAFLIAQSGVSPNKVKDIVDDLIQNQLINKTKNEDSYFVKQMAINFGRQFYSDFAQFEENIVEVIVKNSYLDNSFIIDNQILWVIKSADQLIEKERYFEAQNNINNVIGDSPYSDDYRLYHKLANIQTTIGDYENAEENFRKAIDLTTSDKKLWIDWIQMEKKRGRSRFVISKAIEAITETNNEITIVIELLGMYRYLHNLEDFRNTALSILEYYKKNNDKDSSLILLRHWSKIEYDLIKENSNTQNYFFASDLLASHEVKEALLSLRSEQLKIAKKFHGTKSDKFLEISKKISRVEKDMIFSIDTNIRNMKRLMNLGEKEHAKKEAYKILSILGKREDDKSNDHKLIALRTLFQQLSSESEFNKIIDLYAKYNSIVNKDSNIISIFRKANKLIKYNILKDETKSNISHNRFPFVFQAIKEFCTEFEIEDKMNDVIGLERRFISLHSTQNAITQDFETISKTESKIAHSLLELIDELTKKHKNDLNISH